MMDHHFKAGARAKFDGYEDSYIMVIDQIVDTWQDLEI